MRSNRAGTRWESFREEIWARPCRAFVQPLNEKSLKEEPPFQGGQSRFLKEKAEVSEAFQKENWMLHLFMIPPLLDMIPWSAFLRSPPSFSEAQGRDSVWSDIPFHLLWRKNAPWKFPYVDFLLYIFMPTVSFLTTFKTYALSQAISPKSNAAIASFMDYEDCAKFPRQVRHFYWVKVIVPEHIMWPDSH